MLPEETIDYNIKKTWYNITKMYNRTASEYKASMSLGMILLNINITKGIESTKLGPNMGMKATSLSRSLNKLEEIKLITRNTDSNDKRKSIILLTQEGKEWRELAKKIVLKFNKTVYANFKKEEIEIFFSMLDKINEIINEYE
ncbi:MAG: MarR family transcriptional regulator [Bacteroidota bacterium]|nr:MarR family transcriptional regulator [Bacteroidota bacterium]